MFRQRNELLVRSRLARWAVVCLVLFAFGLSACTATKAYQSTGEIERRPEGGKVLLLPSDVQLFELTAGGALEPKAAWTQTAKANVDAALNAYMQGVNRDLVRYQSPPRDDPRAHTYQQLEKLHEVVGQTILTHKYIEPLQLPTKKDTFDWTLGPDVAILRKDTGADYALFVHMRDSFSSGGRVALQVVAAVFGVSVPGGQQVGFASLVDLQTGDVVWFNRLASSVGDLRKPESARSAIDSLLTEAPL